MHTDVHCPPVPIWEDIDVNSTDTNYRAVINITYLGTDTSSEPSTSPLSVVHVCTKYGNWDPEILPFKSKFSRRPINIYAFIIINFEDMKNWESSIFYFLTIIF